VERAALESDIGAEFTLENDIIRMVEGNDEHWQPFTRLCAIVMRARQAKERVIEKRNRRGRRRI
jgi:hypothetical protein